MMATGPERDGDTEVSVASLPRAGSDSAGNETAW